MIMHLENEHIDVDCYISFIVSVTQPMLIWLPGKQQKARWFYISDLVDHAVIIKEDASGHVQD